MHPRNFGSDKIVRTYVRWPLHVSGCEMVHLLGVQGIYISVFNLVLDFHVIVNWQLSKGYPLNSDTWLYCGLRYTTHSGDFFKSYRLTSFWFSIDRGLRPNFKRWNTLLSANCKSWITRKKHFLKDPSRAVLLALVKSMYYLSNLERGRSFLDEHSQHCMDLSILLVFRMS